MKRTLLLVAVGAVLGILMWRQRSRRALPRSSEVATERSDAVGATSAPQSASLTKEKLARIPKLLPQKPPEIIPSEQNDRGYDASKLARANSLSLASIMYGEVRDPMWAAKRESDISTLVTRDLTAAGVKARLVKTACKHSVCELFFAASDKEELKQANRVMQYALLGDIFEPGAFVEKGGLHYFTAFTSFSAEQRDHDAWKASYQERRKQRLATLKAAGVPAGYPPLPIE